MKIQIESDGTPHGTHVRDETGKELGSMVREVEFHHIAGHAPELGLTLSAVESKLIGGKTRWVIPGLGNIRAVELEDGTRIDLTKEEP